CRKPGGPTRHLNGHPVFCTRQHVTADSFLCHGSLRFVWVAPIGHTQRVTRTSAVSNAGNRYFRELSPNHAAVEWPTRLWANGRVDCPTRPSESSHGSTQGLTTSQTRHRPRGR